MSKYEELDSVRKGNSSYQGYKGYVEQHYNLPDKTINTYYDNGLSVQDILRMEDNNNKIKFAEIIINWKDEYGEGSKTFYTSQEARKFMENATKIREYLATQPNQRR